MPDSIFAITVMIVLSVVSFVLCWSGFRGRNLPYGIMGVGIGIPTFSISDWRAWLIGIGVTVFGYWLREKMEGI